MRVADHSRGREQAAEIRGQAKRSNQAVVPNFGIIGSLRDPAASSETDSINELIVLASKRHRQTQTCAKLRDMNQKSKVFQAGVSAGLRCCKGSECARPAQQL